MTQLAERPSRLRKIGAVTGVVLGAAGLAPLAGLADTGPKPPTVSMPAQAEADLKAGEDAAVLTPMERLQDIQEDTAKKLADEPASTGLGEAVAVDRPTAEGDGIEIDPATGLAVNPADQEAIVTRADGSTETVPASEAMQADAVAAVAGGVSVTATPENNPNLGG